MQGELSERRVAMEAMATLVDIKHAMGELLLKPAGVPPEVYAPLLYRRDPATGRTLSKREIAPLILEALERTGQADRVVRRLVEIAASWSSFHLAHDEYAARATVAKAKEVLDAIRQREALEAYQRETQRREEEARLQRERASLLQRELGLLLAMFDELAVSGDSQRRGYLLQDLLNRLFLVYDIPVVHPYTRNENGEQVDGGFKFDGWYYLVECRWRKTLSDIAELDGLLGKVGRSGKQTMGLFLSVNGWSEHVPTLLKQNHEKSIILMDGYDLRAVLAGQADLKEFLLAKLAKLNLYGEPFFGVKQFLEELGD